MPIRLMPSRSQRRFLLCVALAGLMGPGTAAAQINDWEAAEDGGDLEEEAQESNVRLTSVRERSARRRETGSQFYIDFRYHRQTLATTPGGSDLSLDVFLPSIGADFLVTETLMISAEFAVPIALQTGDGIDAQSDARASNVFLGAAYQRTIDEITFSVGGGVNLPTALLPDDLDLAEALEIGITYGSAQAIRFFRNVGLYVPETLTILPLRAKLRAHFARILMAEGTLDVGILTPIEDTEARDTITAIEVTGMFGVRPVPQFSSGLRLVAVGFVGGSPNGRTGEEDRFQSSMELFVRGNFGAGFVMGTFGLALDEPLGFAFDDNGWWSLGVRVGANI
ncbi:MAG: hypothetical protein AAGF12_03650 [Myxococcota bacterium]